MQRVKDLANKILFVVDLAFLLVIMTCVCVCYIPANLTSLNTVYYFLCSTLLAIFDCLLNNCAKVVVAPTAEIRLNRQFVKLNRNLAI